MEPKCKEGTNLENPKAMPLGGTEENKNATTKFLQHGAVLKEAV